MPYLGDSPSNPIPLVLSGGTATGEATGPADYDRQCAWFSLPAQAAGQSVRISLTGGHFRIPEFSVVMVWDGGNTAHYIASDRYGVRQEPAYRPLPTGASALIGVFPDGHIQTADTRFNDRGQDLGLTPLTAAQWDAVFPADMTRRLPPDVGISVVVEATVAQEGSPGNPLVLDFTTDQSEQTVDIGAIESPELAIQCSLPAGYGVFVRAVNANVFPEVTLPTAEKTITLQNGIVFKPTASTTLTFTEAGTIFRDDVYVSAVRIADVSGSATDTDGASAEPCNALVFRTRDALMAVQSPTGSYLFEDVVEGDYILVAFSRADGRDVVATNFLVPPGERAVGGGYLFAPPPPI